MSAAINIAQEVATGDLDLSDESVLAALRQASYVMKSRFPALPVESYEVTNVLLGRDITAGEPTERDLASGDVIRVGIRLGSLAKRGLVEKIPGGWAPAGGTTSDDEFDGARQEAGDVS